MIVLLIGQYYIFIAHQESDRHLEEVKQLQTERDYNMRYYELAARSGNRAAAMKYRRLSADKSPRFTGAALGNSSSNEEHVGMSVGAALETQGAQERIAAKKEELRKRKEQENEEG